MIAVDEALRRLEISAPERNAILEAFRYADARNTASLASAVQAAQQEATQAAQEAEGARSQQSPALLTSKPFTRCVTSCKTLHRPFTNPSQNMGHKSFTNPSNCVVSHLHALLFCSDASA